MSKVSFERMCTINSNQVARNASWMIVGQGAGVLLQAAYFVMLARLLGAVQYGIFVGAFSFTSLATQYSSLGSGTVFLRYVSGNPKAFARHWGNILLSTCVMSGVLISALWLIGPHVLNANSAALVLLAGTANCLCAQLTAETGKVFQAFEQLRVTAAVNVAMSFMRTLAAGGMLFRLHHATAWQWAVASTVVSVIGAGASVGTVIRRFGWPEFHARVLLQHGLEGVGYSFAGSTSAFYNDVDKTMLSHYGMNASTGVYAMAYRVVDIATIPITAIQSASISRFFQVGRSGVGVAAELSSRLLRLALPLSLLTALLMLVGAPLIPAIAGQAFAESSAALRWLCLIPVFRSVHLMTGCALTGAGHQGRRTGAQLAVVALNFVLNLWLIPIYGWHGAAWSSLATDAALAAVNWRLLQMLTRSEGNVNVPGWPKKYLQMTRRRFRRLHSYIRSGYLSLCSRYGTCLLTSRGGPVVSLTTYGTRINTVYLVIESIARGSLLPSRIVLWLDDKALFSHLPLSLERLKTRGLEVRLCDNYGPHTKYYPYVQGESTSASPLVTADDDILYPRYWLRDLAEAYRREPNVLHCHLAKVISLEEDRVAKYGTWQTCNSIEPSLSNVAHGVAGVIYPPLFVVALKQAGDAFRECCPKADDLWLHVNALRHRFQTKQIRAGGKRFPTIPGTQENGLWVENNATGNDQQAQLTYSKDDIEALSTARAGRHLNLSATLQPRDDRGVVADA